MTGAVLAVLIGSLALVAGLLLMLLPLVASELARPRDSLWAAVVLLLGLVLVTASERLTGAPMLGVLCGGLLIGRLGSEVGQQRWEALEMAQQQRLSETSYWVEQLQQLRGAAVKLLAAGGIVMSWLQERLNKPEVSKRWVRADATPEPASEPEQDTEKPSFDVAISEKAEPITTEVEAEALTALESEPEPASELTVDVEAASEIEAENDLETDSEPEGFAMAANEGPSSDDLPTVEAEVLDPAPQAEQPVAMVIESLDEVDALLADGRHG